jgi:bifunctional pyridoxal-dependent enzyme with beta-cystathionase and maltose regulon repressor activities
LAPLPLVNVQVRACDTTRVADCVPVWVADCTPVWVPTCVRDCETLRVSDWDVGYAAVDKRLLASTAFWSAELL